MVCSSFADPAVSWARYLLPIALILLLLFVVAVASIPVQGYSASRPYRLAYCWVKLDARYADPSSCDPSNRFEGVLLLCVTRRLEVQG